MSSVFAVVITNFYDDYKCRYGDWSSTRRLRVFKKIHNAENYVRETLLNAIHERYEDRDDAPTIADDVSFADVQKLAETHLQGEYVNRVIGWEIFEVNIEDEDEDEDDTSTAPVDKKQKTSGNEDD